MQNKASCTMVEGRGGSLSSLPHQVWFSSFRECMLSLAPHLIKNMLSILGRFIHVFLNLQVCNSKNAMFEKPENALLGHM